MSNVRSLITRQYDATTIALTSSLETTPAIPMLGFAFGAVQVPTGSSITSLAFYGAPSEAGPFSSLHDELGALVKGVAANRIVELPPVACACGAVKIVANTAGAVEVMRKG